MTTDNVIRKIEGGLLSSIIEESLINEDKSKKKKIKVKAIESFSKNE